MLLEKLPGRVLSPKSSVSDDHALVPTKTEEEFRNYKDSDRQAKVEKHYTDMHRHQTLAYVQQQKEKFLKLDHAELTIWEVIEWLDTFVDDSDPDTDVPNSVHDWQTAERIRKAWPEHEWFHLVGLLHDLGKILCLFDEPQWAVVGDIFPVGCRFDERCVLSETFADNPDSKDPVLSTEYGIYAEGCGLDNVHLAWGHDEYMYQVLSRNGCTIPEEGLLMIRYHSLYPWHTGGAYSWMESPKTK